MKMGLFNFFIKDKRHNHEFDEDDRAQSAENRRLNAELRKLEKEKAAEEKRAEIAEMREELKAYKNGGYDEEKGGAEDFFLKMLMSKFMGGAPTPGQGQQQGEQGDEILPPNFDDEEIEGIVKVIKQKYPIPCLLAKIIKEDNIKKIVLNFDEWGILTEEAIEKIAKRLKHE